MAEPILSVRDLKTYFLADEGTVRAVDGARSICSPGQTLGIVGESGCGKSVDRARRSCASSSGRAASSAARSSCAGPTAPCWT